MAEFCRNVASGAKEIAYDTYIAFEGLYEIYFAAYQAKTRGFEFCTI